MSIGDIVIEEIPPWGTIISCVDGDVKIILRNTDGSGGWTFATLGPDEVKLVHAALGRHLKAHSP
jgi:hypothetical protein